MSSKDKRGFRFWLGCLAIHLKCGLHYPGARFALVVLLLVSLFVAVPEGLALEFKSSSSLPVTDSRYSNLVKYLASEGSQAAHADFSLVAVSSMIAEYQVDLRALRSFRAKSMLLSNLT